MTTMRMDEIDGLAVARTVEQLGDTFSTRDVADHPLMRAAHAVQCGATNWNPAVGKAISADRAALRIVEVQRRTARGSIWRRTGTGASQAKPAAPPSPTRGVAASQATLGPQHPGDSAFTGRMRRHQSWWRATVLGVPHGVGPQRGGAPFGNFLTTADGERGLNFLTPAIHAAARARMAERKGTVDPYRLLHNLLSSQPMCFNLFGPLVADRALATTLMSALLPGEVGEVLAVHLEYAPAPTSAHLADATAFDAFIDYRRPDGRLAFLGIETKLTEPFSQKTYDTPAYRRWMTANSPWTAEGAAQVAHIDHNQLWRDHLLAISMLAQPTSQWSNGRLALVRHPLDADCAAVARRYRSLLRPGDDSFRELTLDHIVTTWLAAVNAPNRPWLEAFNLRYLDLTASA